MSEKVSESACACVHAASHVHACLYAINLLACGMGGWMDEWVCGGQGGMVRGRLCYKGDWGCIPHFGGGISNQHRSIG